MNNRTVTNLQKANDYHMSIHPYCHWPGSVMSFGRLSITVGSY